MENNQKTKFRKCPQCSSWIPEHWDMHEKCGWNVPIKEETLPESKGNIDPRLSSICLRYVVDIICAGKVDYKDIEAVHARLMKLMC